MRLLDFVAFNPSRYHLKQFVERAAASFAPGARVLDAGAGHAPYRTLFRHVQYEAIDLGVAYQKESSTLTYLCDLSDIPVRAGSYDGVICTQVLEHVREPALVLAELHRLLKPGGRLWLSTPLFYPEHQVPHDYYRYTQYGLQHLLTNAGFTVERIEWLEGYYGTLAYQTQKGAQALPLHPKHYSRTPAKGTLLLPIMASIKLFFAGLSVFFAHLDARHKLETAGYCKNYTVVAVKPPQK